jgi:hypothetical protein
LCCLSFLMVIVVLRKGRQFLLHQGQCYRT